MDVIKLICIGLVGAGVYILVKSVKSETSGIVLICVGVIMFGVILTEFQGVLGEFNALIDKSNIDNGLFAGVLKVVGIGYIAEYAASVCKDAGCESIGEKILLGAKICIFALSVPLIKTLVELLIGLVE